MLVTRRDLHAVQNLWSELSAFAASKPDDAMAWLLAGITRIIGCTNITWIEASRESGERTDDPLGGWRPYSQKSLQQPDEDRKRRAAVMYYMNKGVFDPLTVGVTAGAGVTRAYLRKELVDDRTWLQSWLYNEVLRPSHVSEMLVGAQAVTPSRESYICMDRGATDMPFRARERNLLQLILSGCPALHREVLHAGGRGGKSATLSARERQVLRLLLTDLSEKEIAGKLGIGWRTTHEYTVSILRKFGVRGRIGLMALWLRHSPPGEIG
jgi:DNA-binding CsgD family transcriptional regulator